MMLEELGEFGFIKRFLSGFNSHRDELVVQPGDDCAAISINNGNLLLVTTDLLAENIHFRQSTIDGYHLGRKCIAVNISDIAAMGGVPTFCFLSIAIPSGFSTTYLEEISRGMQSICREFNVVLAGGDTTGSESGLVINICQLGEVTSEKCLLRSGARTGDVVQVSGPLGFSATGFELLESCQADEPRVLPFIQAHIDPVPQVSLARLLADRGIRSMIDISDGLLQDLGHICEQSQCGAELNLDQLKLSELLLHHYQNDYERAVRIALTGGEDYGLCWTASAECAEEILTEIRRNGFPEAQSIGVITDQAGVTVLKNREPVQFQRTGWDHLSPADHR